MDVIERMGERRHRVDVPSCDLRDEGLGGRMVDGGREKRRRGELAR